MGRPEFDVNKLLHALRQWETRNVLDPDSAMCCRLDESDASALHWIVEQWQLSEKQDVMTEERASWLLSYVTQRPDGSLFCLGRYVAWSPGESTAVLDDEFSADELEAIVWWMRNKGDEGAMAGVNDKKFLDRLLCKPIDGMTPQEAHRLLWMAVAMQERLATSAVGAINDDLTRAIDKMHDVILDTEASGRPAGNLFQVWWNLKKRIEPSSVTSATNAHLPPADPAHDALVKDAARYRFRHSQYVDPDGYEYGYCKVRWKNGAVESMLWADDEEIDAAMARSDSGGRNEAP